MDEMIYGVIEEGNDAAIKLGWTNGDMRARLKQLQTGNWRRLLCVALAPGSVADERDLHALCAHLRIGGEWFRNASCVSRWIEKHRLGEPIAGRELAAKCLGTTCRGGVVLAP